MKKMLYRHNAFLLQVILNVQNNTQSLLNKSEIWTQGNPARSSLLILLRPYKMKINVSAGLGSYLAVLGKIPLSSFYKLLAEFSCLWLQDWDLFPWYIAFFIFKPTILMLQTCDFPFCHICLTPARKFCFYLAQMMELDPLENQVNLILKYTAWLLFAKALLLYNIIYQVCSRD